MKRSCCIEMIFTEFPFLSRIRKACEAGFTHVEFWCWENKDIDGIRRVLDETGMKVGIFQANLEGRMVDARDRSLYVEGVRRSLEVGRILGAENLFLMSDIMQADRSVLPAPYPISEDEKRANTLAVLKELAPLAEAAAITLVIEPLNTKVDHRGYSLCHAAPAFELVREVGSPRIRVLFDAYHLQIMEGNLIQSIRDGIDTIGYFHIADVPGRNEPGTGEINYANILAALSACGYEGVVGHEYEPRNGDSIGTVRDVFARLGR